MATACREFPWQSSRTEGCSGPKASEGRPRKFCPGGIFNSVPARFYFQAHHRYCWAERSPAKARSPMGHTPTRQPWLSPCHHGHTVRLEQKGVNDGKENAKRLLGKPHHLW